MKKSHFVITVMFAVSLSAAAQETPSSSSQSVQANINTSRSNIKQQLTTNPSSGSQSAEANINTSRSNKKQQIASNPGSQPSPEPAEANINKSRANIKNQ
ncbi:hypothetical protein [Flavobacterium muglaense]|uniref:Uncharacterized protein n=1 Tax=Flavobacterium muglaense TaxID=2764716 RepID=A0A923MY58_9FLAO|nr:hypothetical protein [Flavobacterium muglaense]MBC5837965.1 hypothetical protein [Flavobacterium muglaense]MBC5844473.1 hypothetical protein [Flavobacterium muglaense]